MTTTVKHAIRSNAGWAANQVAMEALYGVNGYYTLVSTWEAAQQRDLVALDEIAVLELYKDDFTAHSGGVGFISEGDIVIDGWNTSPANYIDIHAASGEEHSGTELDSFVVKFNANYREFQIYEWNVKFKGFSLNLGGNKSYGFYMMHSADPSGGAFFEVDSCIVFNGNKAGPSYAFRIYRKGSLTTTITNCIAYDVQYGAFFTDYSGASLKNLTLHDCTMGVRMGKTNNTTSKNIADNVVCAFNATDFSFATNTTGQYATNCASSDATILNAGNVSNCLTGIVSADFTDAANDDYSLAAGSQLIDAGADLSGDFTTDIRGETRALPFDIGAFEYVNISASATLSGSATASITETDINDGGKEIILDLTNDTWVAAGSAFDAIRQDILDGLVAAQNEINGWNNVAITAQPVTAVVRTSNTRVTITLVAA